MPEVPRGHRTSTGDDAVENNADAYRRPTKGVVNDVRPQPDEGLSDGVVQWLVSDDARQRLAWALREVGITPPPHNVNTGQVLAALLLERIRNA